MEQPETPKYATLFYEVAVRLNISWAEYMLLEMVYHLSHKTGYCYKSPGYIATDLNLTKRAVNIMINRLQAKGLIERLTDYTLRVSDAYYVAQSTSGKKVPRLQHKPTESPKSGKKVPEVGKKYPGWEKSTPKNYNKNNNRDYENEVEYKKARETSDRIRESMKYNRHSSEIS